MKKRIQSILISALIGFVTASSSHVQAQTQQKPSFDVVSIKVAENCGNTAPGVRLKIPGRTDYQPGGRYTTCNLLRYMIMEAYQIPFGSTVTGVPDWSNDILYKIEAKAEGDPTKDQMLLMVQSMLEDRFKLKMHRESKDGQVYELVVAKGGHKLRQAKDAQGNPLTALPPPDPEKEKALEKLRQPGTRYSSTDMASLARPGSYSVMMGRSGHEFSGKALSIEALCKALYSTVGGRLVIDKTGLTGLYDIDMVYANPYSQQAPPGAAANAQPAAELSAPSIFTALQDQLGLKLESAKAPQENFIIDSVERPAEN